MTRVHRYSVEVIWTGNTGAGTAGYTSYSRDHTILCPKKPEIPGSSDPAFQGDSERWTPEHLLLASISACHQLWYLHLCADAGVRVVSYEDRPEAVMDEGSGMKPGRFTEAVLRPYIGLLRMNDKIIAERMHERAHEQCFIANSVNFPVRCEPSFFGESDSESHESTTGARSRKVR